MIYTPVMWDVADDDGIALGYIELHGDHYDATAVGTDLGSREHYATYEDAGAWLAQQYGKQLELQPRAGDRKGDIQ